MDPSDLPPLLGSSLLMCGAGWFVVRRRGRAAVWAAAGLFGLGAYPVGFTLAAAAGADLGDDRLHTRVAAVAVQGCLGLVFAAVLVDRRRGANGG